MSKRRARSGFTLIEILVVVIIIGVLGSISAANFKSMRDSSDNSAISANLKGVVAGLEQYRSDYGVLPTNIYGVGQTFLCDTNINVNRKYLSNNHLPLTPFSKGYQNNNLATTSTVAALVGAANPGQTLRAMKGQLVVNPGTTPPNNAIQVNFLATDFGAFRYGTNVGLDLYLIQGLGRRGRASVIVDVVTNAL